MEKKYDVFISYSRDDYEIDGQVIPDNPISAIKEMFDKNGVSYWIDKKGIYGGVEFVEGISEAIEISQILVFISSKHSNGSRYTAGEILYAIDKSMHIIPIKIDNSSYNMKFKLLLLPLDYIDYKVKPKTALQDLLRAVNEVKAKLRKVDEKINDVEEKPKPNKEETKQIEGIEEFSVDDVTFNMIHVDGGLFMMGAHEGDSEAYNNERPAHQVILSSYYIGETLVTQALWEAVMGKKNPSVYEDINLPVENVSWDDCQDFISKLNAKTNRTFRLPTEAEWEFAARGGNKSKGYKYAGSNNLNDVAWYSMNSKDKTHPVAQKLPNELGLYDMSGNVWEWCQDWYGMYSNNSQTNPMGTESGDNRVRRGGSWHNNEGYCRITHRESNSPSYHYFYLGLRLAL